MKAVGQAGLWSAISASGHLLQEVVPSYARDTPDIKVAQKCKIWMFSEFFLPLGFIVYPLSSEGWDEWNWSLWQSHRGMELCVALWNMKGGMYEEILKYFLKKQRYFLNGQTQRGIELLITVWNKTKVICANSKFELRNVHPWKIFTVKNIHTWQIFTSEKYSLLRNSHPRKKFTPEKYSPLRNVHPRKMFTPENIHPWKILTPNNA